MRHLREKRIDVLSGGKGDKKSINDFPLEAILKGLKVEFEHTDDPMIALEIAIDHLTEDVEYYDKLEKIDPKH